MVYCKLKTADKKYVSYFIGARSDDMTGEIKIDHDGSKYEIIKQPNGEEVYPHFINRMIIKYLDQFKRGSIPDIMAYEI